MTDTLPLRPMTEMEQKLAAHLERKRAEGVLDIKAHIEVTNSTQPSDYVRAMVSAYDQEQAGELEAVPLRHFSSFNQLYDWLTCG